MREGATSLLRDDPPTICKRRKNYISSTYPVVVGLLSVRSMEKSCESATSRELGSRYVPREREGNKDDGFPSRGWKREKGTIKILRLEDRSEER